jgi:hypothetical protein
MVANNRKVQADLNPPVLRCAWKLWVGMLLERWWSGIGLTPWRTAQRGNHNRNASHRQWATAHEHPGEEETAKDEPDEKALRRLLNQVIPELGHTRAMNLRVFHAIL